MTTSYKLSTATLLIAGLPPLAAMADPPASRPPVDADESVVVIRGSQMQVQGGPQTDVGQIGRTTPASQTEQGVVVMRPASDGFLRETKRLAAEAESREERAAQAEARERDLQLTKTLRAVEDAARAAEEEARSRSERYYPVYVPRSHPPKVHPPKGGTIEPTNRVRATDHRAIRPESP